MRKLVMVGNPNVGKSVVFSRITGASVLTSNYPGTTVEFSQGEAELDGERWTVIDAPGTYSLEPTNKAEEVAKEMAEGADLVLNVVDSTNLERNLNLTLMLLEKGLPTVVALNMWDEAGHLGIHIDTEALEEKLGVPVVPTVALTGEGVKEVVETFHRARRPDFPRMDTRERWGKVGEIVETVQTMEHRHHTLKDRLEELSIKPVTGIPLAMLILAGSFLLVRTVGEGLITYVMDPIFELYRPLVESLAVELGDGILREILVGKMIDGQVDFVESLGVITTGIYVPLAMVLPYVLGFFFVLSLLEDTGYLPRLATLVDGLFHRVGLHGFGIVPTLLGLGCNVPGVLSTRILESRRQRFIAITLISMSVPCMAQTAMIFGILSPYGMAYIMIVFLTAGLLYVLAGMLLNRFMGGESMEIFLEIPPYRRPSLTATGKKTWMRVRWFLKDAIPWLIGGVLLINLLYATGVLDLVGQALSPLITGLLGLPEGSSVALVAGFLRKDLAVGMLAPLGMSAAQLTVAMTVLTIYFPCAASFAVIFRELGPKDMVKSVAIMLSAALIIGIMLRLLLIGV
ncbi:MAG: FeoB small GTPase domain-containing protein [Methanomassiliicoccales archaeon]